VRRMAGRWHDDAIAAQLNLLGWRTGTGNHWTRTRVRALRSRLDLPACDPTQPAWLTAKAAAQRLGICPSYAGLLLRRGLLPGTQAVPGSIWWVDPAVLESDTVRETLRALSERRLVQRSPDHQTLRTKGRLCVARSEWKGHVTAPKGGRVRHVPLTSRLAEALRGARHSRHARVLLDHDGQPLTQKVVQGIMRRVARRAGVQKGVHILRHTFCSHLAMQGAPSRAIQELAGHRDLGTTQRYMHLSPAALEAAIRLLERSETGSRGANGEAAGISG
jgi:hypothetical protein